MGIWKTSDHIQIKIKKPNPSQEPPASSKAQNEDIMFFAPSKSSQRAKIRIMDVSKTSDHIQIKIKKPNPSQKPPASYKAPNEDFKDMDVLCTLKIKIESPNLDHGCVKYQWPDPNQDKDAKPNSGTSRVLQDPKWRIKGHGCSLHLQNQDREPEFGSWVCQRPMTISKLR